MRPSDLFGSAVTASLRALAGRNMGRASRPSPSTRGAPIMFDADTEGADWREVARIVLHIEPEREPDRARRAFERHLARAKWMTKVGYRHLLAVGWWAKCESVARVAQGAAESWKATGGRGACAVSSAIKRNEEGPDDRPLLKSRRGSCIRDGLRRVKSTT
jgi:hypothetical protein